MYIFMTSIKMALIIVSVLVSVAFLTLYERKLLGYTQIRKGPNKLGFKGLLQPLADALKLFPKEHTHLVMANFLAYLTGPILALSLALIIWLAFPASLSAFNVSLSLIFILCVLSAGVYPPLAAGFASNSKFSLLGSLRAVAQTISYEVSLAFILFSLVILSSTYFLEDILYMKSPWFLMLAPLLGIMWTVSVLAETSRTPFDFSEGESELVSGFNTEYSGSTFALFFLGEYSSILFMSLLTSLLFLGGADLNLLLALKTTVVAGFIIWTRSTLPRFRYDKLMELAWKALLPASLTHLMVILSLSLAWYC